MHTVEPGYKGHGDQLSLKTFYQLRFTVENEMEFISAFGKKLKIMHETKG